MIRSHDPRRWLTRLAGRAWREDRAAQIVEFAVALPLLVLFVVGIFDFSGAFTLKQKLTNVARDAARAAAADPATDLSTASVPASVSDAWQLIDQYMQVNKLNECGMTAASYTSGPPGLTWKYTATGNGCPPAGLTIIINRAYYFPANVATQTAAANCVPGAVSSAQTAVVATCVTIQYAYAWRFGRASSLLGSTSVLPSTITTTAVAMNEN